MAQCHALYILLWLLRDLQGLISGLGPEKSLYTQQRNAQDIVSHYLLLG
jgi:hypothetical protein